MTRHSHFAPDLQKLAQRLALLAQLSDETTGAIMRLPVCFVVADCQGQVVSSDILLVDEGIVFKSHFLECGRRSIVEIVMPGEIANLGSLFGDASATKIHTLPGSALIQIPREAFLALAEAQPKILMALMRESFLETERAQRWLTNMTIRNAAGQIAYFVMNLVRRTNQACHRAEDSCGFPFSQQYLSDCLGISLVHVNRSLKTLREARLLSLSQGRLKILNWEGMAAFCGYDSADFARKVEPADARLPDRNLGTLDSADRSLGRQPEFASALRQQPLIVEFIETKT